jgi:hypothetical protein
LALSQDPIHGQNYFHPLTRLTLLHSIFEDYMKCAESILKAKKRMIKNTNTSLVLISSLSAHTDLQWGGAKQRSTGTKAGEALEFLHRAGVKKFDSVIDKDDVTDMIQLVVWDLIAAMEATQFATCSGCDKHKEECAACNYAMGKFPALAMDLRKGIKKKSIKCWPT